MSKSGRRDVLCPRCDTKMDVSTNTKSFLCTGCHRTFRTEDEVVDDYQARVEYYNQGRVEVAKKGIIISEVRVTTLVVKGEVKGNVLARDKISISKTGKITGDVATPLLSMEDGAKLVGRVSFGPFRGEFSTA